MPADLQKETSARDTANLAIIRSAIAVLDTVWRGFPEDDEVMDAYQNLRLAESGMVKRIG